jgi:hypothetical protein
LSITDLRRIYEPIWGISLDPSNLRGDPSNLRGEVTRGRALYRARRRTLLAQDELAALAAPD